MIENLFHQPDDEATHKMPVDVLGEGEPPLNPFLRNYPRVLQCHSKNESLRNEI